MFLGDHPVLKLVGQGATELGGPLSGAGEDQTLHPLTEGDIPGELSQLLVEPVNVGFRPAAGSLEVPPASGVRLAGMDVDLPEAVGSYLLFSMGGTQGRDHKVPEPLGVEDRSPVWFVHIKYERQRGHVRVSPAERLGNVDL